MYRFAKVAVLLAIPTRLAVADSPSKLDAGLSLGGHFFAADSELGADDRMDDPGPSSSAMIGARVGYAATKRVAAEGELAIVPTEDDVLGDQATVFGGRLHARVDLATGRVRPFVVAGVGVLAVRGGAPQLPADIDGEVHWGGGLRIALSKKMDLRFDVRHLLVADRTDSGVTSDVEASAGVGFRFGGKSTPKPRPVVVEIGDRDEDGLLDNVDRCADKPEDLDAFEDADGCPDPDNDGDLIADLADKCPLEPETPNEWKDEDGCPDAVITEIAGIGFTHASAQIDPTTEPVLEKALSILKDNPKLRVEISGHTSSEGNAARNLELSLHRAEAVETWLIGHGIDDTRIEVVGHGSEIPLASNETEVGRAQNRRIEFRVLVTKEAK